MSWGSVSSMKIEGSRNMCICFLNTGHILSLKDCLFMPSIGLNLISTSKLKSYSLVTPTRALMFQKGSLLTIGEQSRGLYYLPVQVQNQALVLQESQSRKRKVSSSEEPAEQTSKRQKTGTESIEELLKRADQTLLQAKCLGKALLKATQAAQQKKPLETKAKKNRVQEAKKAKRATLSL